MGKCGLIFSEELIGKSFWIDRSGLVGYDVIGLK